MSTYPVLKTNIGIELVSTALKLCTILKKIHVYINCICLSQMANDFKLIVKGKYNPFVVKWPDLAKRIIYFAIENKICEAQTSNSDST